MNASPAMRLIPTGIVGSQIGIEQDFVGRYLVKIIFIQPALPLYDGVVEQKYIPFGHCAGRVGRSCLLIQVR